MRASALIDTGAMLALLDKQDGWHHACVSAFAQMRLPLLTSNAVLTELFHLVRHRKTGMESAWRFVRSGAIEIAEIPQIELPLLHALMSRYWDRPMDFADATLVHMAARESLTTILTVDHDDFETYRLPGGRKFRILPASRG